jgi:hypothetical protein
MSAIKVWLFSNHYRLKDKIQYQIARILPHWLVARATIRLLAYATTGQYGSTIIGELTVIDALKRWEDKSKT